VETQTSQMEEDKEATSRRRMGPQEAYPTLHLVARLVEVEVDTTEDRAVWMPTVVLVEVEVAEAVTLEVVLRVRLHLRRQVAMEPATEQATRTIW